jgi:CheY-like chemotaxis protein
MILDSKGILPPTGKIAIEKLQDKTYDIILMDLQMPVMNGFEATAYIRNKMNSAIPIIALTADVTTVDIEKCKAIGMNDYIAKPVDERLLYNKIIGLVKKPLPVRSNGHNLKGNGETKKSKCIDLDYLIHRTKSDPGLMMEMISLYLEQTPLLVQAMKESLADKDWDLLHASIHKMIPSFSIMGINPDFENMAKQVQEYTRLLKEAGQEANLQLPENISKLVLQLETVCLQACKELKEEYNLIKNTNS